MSGENSTQTGARDRYLKAVADDLIIAAKALSRAEKQDASPDLLERLREIHTAADKRWYIANGFPLPQRFTD